MPDGCGGNETQYMRDTDPNADLFQESRMSFGEHLEELRKVLFRALAGIVVGCVIGTFVGESVVDFLQTPLRNAINKFHIEEGKSALRDENGFVEPDLQPWLEEEKTIPDRIYVDPGQLVEALRSVSPDFLKSVKLSPYEFRPHHINQKYLPLQCESWAGETESNSQKRKEQKFLWSLLSDEDKSLVKMIGESDTASDEDCLRFTQLLNKLTQFKTINESKEFQPRMDESSFSLSQFMGPQKPNELAAMKEHLDANFDEDLSRRINRSLIAGAFNDGFAQVRSDLVPITVWKSANFKSQALGATEGFMIWLKAVIATGLVIASPWVFYQLWAFVAAGLYKHEKKYIYIYLPISLLLFFSGVCLAFFFVFEPVLDFLFGFNARMGIAPQPRINDWLSFVLFLPLGFGVAFQLPLVMLFMNRINLFSVNDYLSKWRVAVLIIFALSMLLTPADPISMIMLAFPLTALYFLGVGLCKWFPGKTNPFEEPAEA